jgi:hypothetical protein
MFRLDTHTHKQMGEDRIDSLNRSWRIEVEPAADATPTDRQGRGGITPAPPLPRLRVRPLA